MQCCQSSHLSSDKVELNSCEAGCRERGSPAWQNGIDSDLRNGSRWKSIAFEFSQNTVRAQTGNSSSNTYETNARTCVQATTNLRSAG
eukprot:6200435-Pleurochrysis_carterae.AAC.1